MYQINFITTITTILLCASIFSVKLNGQDSNFKRFQYDEFIYGITVPNLKNINEIGNYYKIKEDEIHKFNQRLGYAQLSYQKGKIIFLPAGTLLKNKNIAFEHLSSLFKELNVYSIDSVFQYSSKTFNDDTLKEQTPISDTLLTKYLSIPLTLPNCIWGCSYAIATINLGNNYKGFIVSSENTPNSDDYLYIFFHNDYLRRIRIGGIVGGDGGYSLTKTIFKDFDSNGTIDILIETEKVNYTSYSFKDKVVSIDSKNEHSDFIEYKTYRYKFYKLINGIYINSPIDLDIPPEK